MKQTKEDRLIAEAYSGESEQVVAVVDENTAELMGRVLDDLEKLEQMLNNPNVPEATKASIENFFYNIKDMPI